MWEIPTWALNKAAHGSCIVFSNHHGCYCITIFKISIVQYNCSILDIVMNVKKMSCENFRPVHRLFDFIGKAETWQCWCINLCLFWLSYVQICGNKPDSWRMSSTWSWCPSVNCAPATAALAMAGEETGNMIPVLV